jgi:hypothetical protein
MTKLRLLRRIEKNIVALQNVLQAKNHIGFAGMLWWNAVGNQLSKVTFPFYSQTGGKDF